MDKIVEYIKSKYSPSVIIIYGSYADKSNNMNSDFDALVLSPDHENFHDTSIINSIPMDIFVYHEESFTDNFNPADFPQLADSEIVLDTNQKGINLKNQVIQYIESLPVKSKKEIEDNIFWCIKMSQRTKRQDTEGYFRWHWVLADSLEIFCDAVHRTYKGPKKSLRQMEAEHPEAFSLYIKALANLNHDSLADWIDYLKSLIT